MRPHGVKSPQRRFPVPENNFADLDGKELRLGEFRGKVVLLVFWSHFGDRSGQLLNTLRAIDERHAEKPFVMLGINQDAGKSRLTDAVNQKKIAPTCLENRAKIHDH